ncbi:MAG: DUF2249 domain-containing protein [Candidatus Hydrothermarchaeaceae archaeon]
MPKILDVRGLPHIERPPKVMEMVSKLGKGESFVLITEIEPLPMIGMLRQRGARCESRKVSGHWETRVTK